MNLMKFLNDVLIGAMWKNIVNMDVPILVERMTDEKGTTRTSCYTMSSSQILMERLQMKLKLNWYQTTIQILLNDLLDWQ